MGDWLAVNWTDGRWLRPVACVAAAALAGWAAALRARGSQSERVELAMHVQQVRQPASTVMASLAFRTRLPISWVQRERGKVSLATGGLLFSGHSQPRIEESVILETRESRIPGIPESNLFQELN